MPSSTRGKIVPTGTDAKKALSISSMQLMAASLQLSDATPRPFGPPELFPGVLPKRRPSDYVALDSQHMAPFYSFANQMNCAMGFPGYAYLSELAQRTEYISPSETIAQEMTRKWIDFTSKGDGDKSDKIKKIKEAFQEYKIRDHFRTMAKQDGFFGRAQLFIDIKGQDDDRKRQLPLLVDPRTIPRDSLLGFTPVEAIWTTPSAYNSIDPTKPNFFKPEGWFILGKRTHASRLMTFIMREVPDLLKPSYNFGGLSMSQLMETYVNQWLRTRNSVSNLLHSFSTSVLATSLAATLEGGTDSDIFKRAQLFNLTRDNRGLMIIDKDTEDLVQVNTPLSGLADLQAQAQEHMSAPCHIPLVKLLGVTPSGLNASSEGEIIVFYDFVNACQEAFFTNHLTTTLRIVQLSLFGVIDEDIGFVYNPLSDPTPEELSKIRKADSDRAVAYIDRGVISPEEERERLASDPSSGYDNIDPNDLPELPADSDAERDHELGQEGAEADHKRTMEQQAAAAKAKAKETKGKKQKVAADQFSESDHPRDKDGKFSSSAGTWGGAELISSQEYRDDKIVAEKMKNKDFKVALSPEFKVDGKTLRVILDGHHSFEAAIKSGNVPEFEEHGVRENDKIALLKRGKIEEFLEATHLGDDYHNISTKQSPWS